MTEQEKRMIESYLPNPRDPSLDDWEYYVLDNRDRVQRVSITDIGYNNEKEIYLVRNGRGIVQGDYHFCGEAYGFRKGYLYDNREDCRNHEHDWYDEWESLRTIQQENEYDKNT